MSDAKDEQEQEQEHVVVQISGTSRGGSEDGPKESTITTEEK